MGFISDSVTLDRPHYVHESAYLYGKVYVGPGVSIWPNVVTRAEFHEIRIGARSNIQDFVMIHVGAMTPTIVGEDCSITHHATLHGCEIGYGCLIGINATIMDGAKIGAGSIVAGNTIVTENTEFPPHSIIAGVPGKRVAERDNTRANVANARMYEQLAKAYAQGRDRLSDEELQALIASFQST